MAVEFCWIGGVTTTEAVVVARIDDEADVRLAVSINSNMSSPVFSSTVATNADNVAKLTIGSLTAGTQYYYAIEVDSVLDDTATGTGQFQTFPAGNASFSFAAASCSGNNSERPYVDNDVSNNPVFDAIRLRDPMFFIHMGDLHYRDIATDSQAAFRQAYQDVLSQERQRNLYRNVPIAYVWDDHDYGPNNSNASSASRPAARTVYQEYVPHYPLAVQGEPAADTPIYQQFRCGRVQFLLCDNRSERNSQSMTDSTSKRMLSEAQENWLTESTVAAFNAGAVAVFWVLAVPWIGEATAGADFWSGYSFQRRRLGKWLRSNGYQRNVFLMSGDMHAVAIDDGTNSQYVIDATEKGPACMVFAAMDANGSEKGGPYSQGISVGSPGGQRYGWVDIDDQGDKLVLDFYGVEYDLAEEENINRVELTGIDVFDPVDYPPTGRFQKSGFTTGANIGV